LYRLGLWDHQNPPQKGGFFYFTGLVAKQVAREGFSDEIKLCLNLNDTRNNLYRSNFADDLQALNLQIPIHHILWGLYLPNF
jgi:hypothetical protein